MKAKYRVDRWMAGLAVAVGLSGSVLAGEMQPTSRALIELDRTPGWNLGGQLRLGRRALDLTDDTLQVDTRQATVRVGVRLLPLWHVWGELGAGQADRRGRFLPPEGTPPNGTQRYEEDGKGSAGLVLGGGMGVSVFEYVLRSSPVFGHQESLALDLLGTYRVGQSDLPALRRFRYDPGTESYVPDLSSTDDEGDLRLRWKDARLAALFVYRLNRKAEVVWRGYEPTGYALRGGPLYVRTTGTYGGVNLREAHDFGAVLGFDARYPSGWLGRVDVQWMNTDDREVTLSVHRFF